jgi:hypothetical protein
MTSEPIDPPIAFVDIPTPSGNVPSAQKVIHGKTFLPQQQILLFSAAEWEEFIKEWVHYQKTKYNKVVRLAGAGDMGIDVAGLTDAAAFDGVWDCYQCKHYDEPLTPTTALPEIGKILWYSFNKKYKAPRKYYFIAPRSCGPKLKKQLLKPADLKAHLITEWNDSCAKKLTSKEIKLEGDFAVYVTSFDFSIFTFRPALDIIDEHRETPFHAARFGGGLPERPPALIPPAAVQDGESRYIQHLYHVYTEEIGTEILASSDLTVSPTLSSHLDRQREYFYSAESLRNFARDAVPDGTFEDLQSEVYAGVIEIEQDSHPSSMKRLNAVTQAATTLEITANGLISVTKIQDRRGICHQLANDDRLRWKKP